MMLSEKWRPLIVTLSVIAAIFTALFVLAFVTHGWTAIAPDTIMHGFTSWASSWHMGGCMR